MNETAAIATPAVEEFHASVNVEDANVYVSAKTLPAFLAMLARLGVSVPAAAIVSAPEPAQVKETPKAEKPEAEKTAAASTPAEAPSSAPAAQTASDAKPSADASAPVVDGVSYDQLRAAIFKLAAQDKTAAGEVVASFGVKSFKDLDASRWAEALAAVNAKLEG